MDSEKTVTTSFQPFSKKDIERVTAQKAARGNGVRPNAMVAPQVQNTNGQTIPHGRVAMRHGLGVEEAQTPAPVAQPQRPAAPVFNPHQRSDAMSIPDQDAGAPFGRRPDGAPMTVGEFARQRLGATAPPMVGQASEPFYVPNAQPVSAPLFQPRAPAAPVQPQRPTAPKGPHVYIDTEQAAPSYIQHEPLQHVAPTFVQDPEGIAVDLPSRFAFYEFKDLFILPLRGYHLAKLAAAHAQKSQLIMLEVVSSVLRTSHPAYQGQPLAHYLLLGDYYWVLYYLRRSNYTKSTFIHTTRCTDTKHIEAVHRGELPDESLKIQETITKSSLKNTMLEMVPVPDPEVMGEIQLRPANMQDMIETMEHPRFGKDKEFDYLSQLACYLYGATLEDRIRAAGVLEPDQIGAIQEYERTLAAFGIEETINVRCKQCGASRRTRVRIDAATFLPA